MPINWLSWTADAFARARAQQKPVLLSIATTWSRSCQEMERTSYADAGVAALVNERFVPIRVDADRRPDIGNRYSLGGWPTTAFLTGDGEVLGGGTYVELDRFQSVLRQVSEAFTARRDAFADRGGDRPPAVAAHGAEPVASLTRRIFEAFDEEASAFGGPPYFPHTAPVHLALALVRESSSHSREVRPQDDSADSRGFPLQAEEIAITALDAMGWGGLSDEADGGFFRYANEAPWRHPQPEKLLDVNAAMLLLYCDAWQTFQFDRYRERAAEVLRFLQTWLADPVDGGWAASPRADGAGAAAAGSPSRTPPAVDEVLYSDWNAAAASAVLTAARVFADDGLRDFAVKSLERTLLQSYRPGGGVAHFVDGRQQVRGLLDDHVAMAAANLDAFDATGNIVYEMMAEELAHFALRTMWDEERGGFFDRVHTDDGAEVGLLRRPVKPFVVNCEAARVLRRLAASSGDDAFGERAQRTLAAMAAAAASHGPLAAHYVIAVREAGAR